MATIREDLIRDNKKVITIQNKQYRACRFYEGQYVIELYEIDENGLARGWLPKWSKRYNDYKDMNKQWKELEGIILE